MNECIKHLNKYLILLSLSRIRNVVNMLWAFNKLSTVVLFVVMELAPALIEIIIKSCIWEC